MMKEKQKTNRVLTIVLILGTVTVFFPLYMAAIIAFKKPSEMTNDELAECIESARLAPAKYVREDELNFHREAIREAAARLRNLGEIGEEVGLEATREKSSQVGNAAEMRDACAEILLRMRNSFKWIELADSEIVEEASSRNEEAERKRKIAWYNERRLMCKCRCATGHCSPIHPTCRFYDKGMCNEITDVK